MELSISRLDLKYADLVSLKNYSEQRLPRVIWLKSIFPDMQIGTAITTNSIPSSGDSGWGVNWLIDIMFDRQSIWLKAFYLCFDFLSRFSL